MRLRLTPSGLTMDRVRSSAISGVLSGTDLEMKPDSLPFRLPPRQKRPTRRLDRETLPAAALPFDIGVAEAERLVEALLDEIHGSAVDQRQAFRIDADLDASVLEHEVPGIDLVGVVHDVGEAGAARLAHPQP